MIAGEETVPLAACALPARRRGHHKRPASWAALPLLCIIILWPVSTSAGISPDSEYLRQLRREGHSEFCADTTEPPKPDGMAAAMLSQHPSFQPLAEWLNAFVAMRRERCHDS